MTQKGCPNCGHYVFDDKCINCDEMYYSEQADYYCELNYDYKETPMGRLKNLTMENEPEICDECNGLGVIDEDRDYADGVMAAEWMCGSCGGRKANA